MAEDRGKEKAQRPRGRQLRSRVRATLLAAFISFLFIEGLLLFPPTRNLFLRLEYWAQDFRTRMAPAKRDDFEVAIVAVDEASFTAFRKESQWNQLRWPWPPVVHGELAKALIEEGGAEVVVFDISFSESFQGMYKEVYADLTDLVSHPEKKIFGSLYDLHRDGPGRGGWVEPVKEVMDSGSGIAAPNLAPRDQDGVIRRIEPVFNGRPAMSLLAATRLAFGPDGLSLPIREVLETFRLGDEPHGIRFYGPPGAIPTTSYADVLLPGRRARVLGGEKGLRRRFEGKAVFVGATVKDLHDLHNTAEGAQMPGVEIHATCAQNFLDQVRVIELSGTRFPIGVLFAAFVALATALLGPVWGVFCTVGGGMLYLMGTAYLFSSSAFLWPWAAPITVLIFCSVLCVATLARRERRDRNRVRDMFGRFVAPSVVTELVEHEDDEILHGRMQTLTILFGDIVGFTSRSEDRSPAEVFRFLSDFLGQMTGEVLRTGGTLDKYIGDALMAFWGAPLPFDDGPSRAVDTAIGMRRKLES
ncbi:MAG: CHASE2 domain-containing protein, partial [Planctomycetota bacterium]